MNLIDSPPASKPTFDLIQHLTAQRAFSLETFGPGQKTAGILAHIRKELAEIEANPADLVEWMDVALLAFDGAMRNGGTPELVAQTLAEKFARNQTRQWPDWRTQPDDQPIEHVRTEEAPAGVEHTAAHQRWLDDLQQVGTVP